MAISLPPEVHSILLQPIALKPSVAAAINYVLAGQSGLFNPQNLLIKKLTSSPAITNTFNFHRQTHSCTLQDVSTNKTHATSDHEVHTYRPK